MHKLWLLLGLCLLLLPLGSAALTDDAYMYWTFDTSNVSSGNPLDITGNARDGTSTGTPTSVTGKINEAFDFDGSTEYVTSPWDYTDADFSGTTKPWTFAVWLNSSQTTTGAVWGDNDRNQFWINLGGSGNCRFVVYSGVHTHTCNVNDGDWHYIVFGFDGTDAYYSIDGGTIVTWNEGTFNTNNEVKAARRGTDNQHYYDGILDELFVWNRSLSQAEITELYNSGNGLNPYTQVVTDNFTIEVDNLFNGSAIQNFTAEVNGVNYTSVNGSVTTPFNKSSGELVNISLFATDYISRYFIDINVSENNSFVLYQSIITFDGFEYLTNNSLIISEVNGYDLGSDNYNFNNTPISFKAEINNSGTFTNYSLNSSCFYNQHDGFFTGDFNISMITTEIGGGIWSFQWTCQREGADITPAFPALPLGLIGGSATAVQWEGVGYIFDSNFTVESNTSNKVLYLNKGNHTLLADPDNYYPENFTIEVNALDNKTINLSGFYNSIINLTVLDNISGSLVSEYNITATSSYLSFTNNTPSDNLSIPWIQGINLSTTFTKNGYKTVTESFSPNSSLFNYQLTTFRTIDVSISFFDEETLNEVNNVTFNLLSNELSNSFNTGLTNNTAFIPGLPQSIYEVRFSTNLEQYQQRSYYFSIPLTTSSEVNISLYMLEVENTSLFSRTVFDENSLPLTGKYIEIQRPYTNNNATVIYRTVERALIDSSGNIVFAAIPNTQAYRMRLLNESLQFVNARNPEFFIDTQSEITFILSGSITGEVNTITGITSSLSYNNATSSFVLDYSNAERVSEVCLEISHYEGINLITDSTTCASSSSATIAGGINTSKNITYNAYSYAVLDGSEYALNVLDTNLQKINDAQILSFIGPVIWLLIIIVAATMSGFNNPIPGIALAIGGTLALSLQFIGLIGLSATILSGLLVVGLIILFLVFRG